MGGGHYDGDVAERAGTSGRDVFTYQGYGQGPGGTADPTRRECHPDLNIKGSGGGKMRECRDSPEHGSSTPIIAVIDDTRSRGDDARVMYEKLPMFIGQIIMKGYVPDPRICPVAVGNATCDHAPIQVGQFESDNRLDDLFSKLWLEGGGGGTGSESYELMAYCLARHTELDCVARGRKGYCFFLGDAGFHPRVSKTEVQKWIGDTIPADIDSAEVFRELQQKYHTFFIYPQKSWEERKADIDEEIRQRVLQAGGMYEGVDVRASLVWNNRNDLDLHVFAPGSDRNEREHIWFSNKVSPSGGELDVDRNVGGETSKPVENIRWKKGTAPSGPYRVYVQNYRFHESSDKETQFRVELEINGTVQHFEGVIPAGSYGPQSAVKIQEFTYDANQRTNAEDVYAGFHDDVILKQWASVIPRERILRIADPRAIVDVVLGALAITEGTSDLDGYVVDMEGRGQTEKRRVQTRTALEDLATAASLATAETGAVSDIPAPRRGGKSRRL